VPAVANVCDRVAVPEAAAVEVAAAGTTLAVPRLEPLAENVTVPVGPFPLLTVVIAAVRVTEVVVFTLLVGAAVTDAAVGAAVTITVSVTAVVAAL